MMLVRPSSQRTRYRRARRLHMQHLLDYPAARGLSNHLRLDHDPAPDCCFNLALVPMLSGDFLFVLTAPSLLHAYHGYLLSMR